MEAYAPVADSFTVLAGPDAHGQRLDRFLAEASGTLSRSRVKSLIERGCAYRNGDVARDPSELIRSGATYALHLPPAVPAAPQAQPIAFPILFEDTDLVVLDKPAGLVVHPAPGNEDGTLVNAVLAHCGSQLTGIGGERRPGIVHRLDKGTSGVMVVAKTQMANTVLTAAFAARDIDRAYLALTWGVPNPSAGDILGDIGRDKRDRKRMAVVTRNGKPALTHYRLLRNWRSSIALLECRLATGRTHQIRVHLASRGNPVIGDPLYLRRVPAMARVLTESVRRQLLDFPRQALHAARLAFAHPRTGETMSFETNPPPDMLELMTSLDRDLQREQV